MNRIETKILNCSAVSEAEKTMVFAARLTQRGHLIHNMEDLIQLYDRSFTKDTVKNMGQLPHPTIQKFAVITVAIVDASRRFLSQITRHQNEVKFMSASLQYSNYSGQADFVKPYEILAAPSAVQKLYETSFLSDINYYGQLCKTCIGHDSAGYLTPQALRNVMLISATPYQWKHMIGQRSCRRNIDEMRIVILKIWKDLYDLSPTLFLPELTGPFCQRVKCLEGKMSCGHPMDKALRPTDIILQDYPLLMGGEN